MELSLTELRQRLFELADRVLETGEAIIITRRGRKLRIVRDDEASMPLILDLRNCGSNT